MSDGGRVKEVFLAAVAIEDDGEREAFLQDACADDPDLLARVRTMLDEDDVSLGPLDRSVGSVFAGLPIDHRASVSSSDEPPRSLGGYEIIRELGSGGMGIVYEARQRDPSRRVAVKVLGGASGAEAIRRFRREAHLLGRLSHPNIASIYEANSHSDSLGGRPYFVMELIDDARPIDAYCADNELTTEQRLGLFLSVCDAVEHGHQRGIIHRDLKPGNILVGADGVPKVIDFGVAGLASSAELSMVSLSTNTNQVIGTLRYMSPELFRTDSAQRPGEPDVRSDVFALGVVLYEMLCGCSPYPITTASPFDLPRIIRDKDPTKLTTHRPDLRGDLSTIVGKAMAREPERRYQSVGALAADVRRFLDGQPIEARRDHALYVLRKSLVRYRAAVGVAAFIAVLTTASAITFAALYRRAERAHAETLAKNTELERTNYRNLFALAQNAYESFNVREAKDVLSRCPEPLRGWEWGFMRARCDDSVQTLDPGVEDLNGFVSIDDGRRAVVAHGLYDTGPGGFKSSVGLWNVDAGELERTLFEYHRPLAVAKSRDETLLAIGSHDQRVWVIDLATGRLVHEFTDLEFRVGETVFSPDGRALFVSSGGVLSRYDLERGERVAEVKAHNDWRMTLLLFPGGSQIATTAIGDPKIRLWDAETLEPIRDLGEHPGECDKLAVTPDARYLFSGSADGLLRRWDLGRGSVDLVIDCGSQIQGIRVSPDSETLALFLAHSIQLRRVGDGQPIGRLRGHDFECWWGDFNADGTELLTCDRATIKRWRVDHLGGITPLSGAPADGFVLLPSPDGRWLAAGDESGDVTIWDAKTLKPVASWKAHDNRCRSLSFSHDGTKLATGGDDGTAAIWNTSDWSLARRITAGNWIRNLAWEPDDRTLIVGQDALAVLFYDVESGELLDRIDLPNTRSGRMDLSADGGTIVVGSQIGKVFLIDVETRAILRTIEASVAPVNASFMPNPTRLMTYSGDGSMKIWDWRTGELLDSIDAHSKTAAGVSFSPDGTRMVSSAYDSGGVIWDLATHEPLLHLDTGGSTVRQAVFSGDGERIFARTQDNRLLALESVEVEAPDRPATRH